MCAPPQVLHQHKVQKEDESSNHPDSREEREHTRKWSESTWCFTNHFSKDLPKYTPQGAHLTVYIDILQCLYDTTRNQIRNALLEHLHKLSEKHNLVTELYVQPGKSIESIHNNGLSSSNKYNEEYLLRVPVFPESAPETRDRLAVLYNGRCYKSM